MEEMSKSKIKDIYKMTPMQQGMFFHSLLDNENKTNTYCNQEIFKMTGTVDKELIEKSFTYLVENYDIFRTIFKFQDGKKPLQIVLDKYNFETSFYDISDMEERNKYFAKKLEEDFNRGFDLSREIAIRISMYKMADDCYNVVWTYHHIILDGWSIGIVYKDFISIYNMLMKGEDVQFPQRPPYKKYIEWLTKKDRENGLAYWKDYLKGYENPDFFNANKKTSTENEYQADSYEFQMGKERTQKIIELAKGRKVTSNTILQTAWGILLQKCNAAKDVVYGTVVSGRTSEVEGIEDIVGLFINTIPVRVCADNNDTFYEVLDKVNNDIIKSKSYDYLPLIDVQAQSTAKNNLISSLFVYENFLLQDELDKVNGSGVVPFSVDIQMKQSMTNYDLNFVIYPLEIYNCKFLFNSNVYEKASIEGLSKIYMQILDEIVSKPNVKIGDIELVSEEERNRLLRGFNDTDTNYPHKTMYQLFEEQVERTPDNIAVKCREEEITYDQLNKKANSLARKLLEKGIKPDDIIALMVDRSISMIVGIMAILKAGACYLPIDPNYPKERIKYTLEDSKAKLLLCSKEFYCEDVYSGEMVDIEDESNYLSNCENLGITSSNENLAYIIYTSGTTGNPKGVMVEHRNLVRLMFNDKFQFNFTSNDVWTMFHSYCFDFSVWEMYGALFYGGKLIIVHKEVAINTAEFLDLLKKERVTVLNQIPTVFYNLMNLELNSSTRDLNLKYIIFGGEALKPAMLKFWHKKYSETKLINMYGITETTVHVTYKEICENEIEAQISNIGSPIPTLTVYIMDENLRLKPVGMPGEICVGGLGVARGYLNQEELTKIKFLDNPYKKGEKIYRSGDLGRWMDDGNLEYLGRIDHQVKIRGFRIELGEIESSLLGIEGMAETTVMEREDKSNKYLCAYYVSDRKYNPEEIRKKLMANLPEYMIPSFFIRVNNMPQTENGKLDKKSLPNPYQVINAEEYFEEEVGEIEVKLANIWKSVLGINSIGKNDNFFTIGGDSIKAINIITLINKTFGTNIQLFSLYKNHTIKQMGDYLNENMSSLTDEDIVRAKAEIEALKSNILNDAVEAVKLPDDYEDFYPMSDIELGMIYHSLLNPEEEIYHDQFIYQVEDLDEELLKSCLEIMVKKHSILRTSFNIYDFSVPIQIVHKNIMLNFEKVKVNCKNNSEKMASIKDYMKLDRKQPFNVKNAPVWRVKIFEFDDDEKYIGFFVHHAILDGWSVATFITELAEVYSKLKQGNFTCEPLKCDYKYSIYEQQAIKSNNEIIEYWRKELSGYNNDSSMFGIYEDDKEEIYEKEHVVNDSTYENLKNVSAKYGVTIKTICFAAYAYMINMMSQHNDIVIGLVGNNRPICEDGDKVLGCFLNTVPIRIKIEHGDLWEDLLKYVDNKVMNMAKYGRLALPDIAKITGKRDVGDGNILFDTVFNFVDFHVYNKINSKQNKILYTYDKANTSLDVTVSNMNDKLLLAIRGNGKFSKESIDRMMEYFLNILNMFVVDMRGIIDKRKILTKDEETQLLYGFNNTSFEYDKSKSIDQLFEEKAAEVPNDVAVVCGEKEITYGELNQKANRLAITLNKKGVKPGDIVGLMADRSIEIIIGIIGILKSGAAYLPMDPDYPEDRIRYMLEDSKAKALITEKDYKDKIKFNGELIDLYEEASYSEDLIRIDQSNDANKLLYTIYTSGTTGKPKGVMIGHSQVLNFIGGVIHKTNISECQNILCITTIAFDICVLETLLPLIKGMKIILTEKYQDLDGDRIANLINKNSIEVIQSTPSRIKLLMEDNKFRESVDSLKMMLIGGETMPEDLYEKLQSYEKLRVFNMYGPTETTVWSTVKEIKSTCEINIGKPIQNTKIFILNENMNMQPIGIPGELYIGGDGLAVGYINNETLTNERFIENPYEKGEKIYKTGDIARWLLNGDLEHLGRADDQVKIRGYRIELGEIENALINMEGVKEAAVITKEKDGNKYLCAYYIGENDYAVGDFREFLRLKLPEYMLPTFFIKLEKMPLTPNGKIHKKALPDIEGEVNIGTKYAAPTKYIELKLVSIWKELLCVQVIGIDDNFFELGGNSLKAMILSNKIYKEFDIEIEVRNIFEKATIKELANYIKYSPKHQYMQIERVERKAYYETSSAQRRMYLLQQFDLSSVAYNMPMSIEIEGDLSIERIEETFNYLIDRHEVFRTEFKIVQGEIVQAVKDQIDSPIKYSEVHNLKEINKIKDEFTKPFDLASAPLLRVKLLKIEKEKYELLIDMHHIISDALSMGILSKEFLKVYSGKELQPLSLQYKDYSLWHNKMKTTDKYKNQKEYWINQFKERVPALKLTKDYDKKDISNYEGGDISFNLGKEATVKLKKSAKESEVTTFMMLLSIFAIQMAKYSDNNDIVIGTPIAGRNHRDLEDIIGVFTNTLPLRLNLEPQKSYGENLNNIREVVLNAYENQEYQYEELVEHIDLERNRGRENLFNIMFIMESNNERSSKVEGINVAPPMYISKTAKYELTLNAMEYDEDIELTFNYNKGLYSSERIEAMRTHYKNILNQVLDNHQILFNYISLLDTSQTTEKELEIKQYIEESIHEVEFNF